MTGPLQHNRPPKASAYRGPLRQLRKRVRRRLCGHVSALEQVCGAAIAAQWLAKFQRAEINACPAVLDDKRDKRGRRRGVRYTARARFHAGPQRDVDHDVVRNLVMLTLGIFDRLGPGQLRVWHKALFLGHEQRPVIKQAPNSLAGELGRCTRVLERYLAVLRGANIFHCWQPPLDEKTPECARSKNGFTYNCYQLLTEIPRPLREMQEAYWETAAHAARVEERQALTQATPPSARAAVSPWWGLALALVAMLARGSPAHGPPGGNLHALTHYAR